eukprot:6173091-Pleurochrysis_carterae.AAC.1
MITRSLTFAPLPPDLSRVRWLVWLPTAERVACAVRARRARPVTRLSEHPARETTHPTRLPQISAAVFCLCLFTPCGRLPCSSLPLPYLVLVAEGLPSRASRPVTSGSRGNGTG